jgi:catechol 2,3-dioxygenase-like lactoylglutathione lyase family enzyme
MKPLGVNRVTMAVRDLDKAVEIYSKLLNTTFFYVTTTAEPFGIDAALSWDAGIEICAPLPNRDSEIAQLIEKRGEGILGVTLAVDDIEEARTRAEEIGAGIKATVEFSSEELDKYLQARFRTFKEYVLAEPAATCGVRITLGQFDPK